METNRPRISGTEKNERRSKACGIDVIVTSSMIHHISIESMRQTLHDASLSYDIIQFPTDDASLDHPVDASLDHPVSD